MHVGQRPVLKQLVKQVRHRVRVAMPACQVVVRVVRRQPVGFRDAVQDRMEGSATPALQRAEVGFEFP